MPGPECDHVFTSNIPVYLYRLEVAEVTAAEALKRRNIVTSGVHVGQTQSWSDDRSVQ